MEHLYFAYCMHVLEDEKTSESVVLEIINHTYVNIEKTLQDTATTSNPEIQKAHQECLQTLDYWKKCLTQIQQMTHISEVKPLILQYFATTNPYNFSKYNIGQGVMKATTHILWKKLASLCQDGSCHCHLMKKPGLYHYQLCVKEIAHDKGYANAQKMMDDLESVGVGGTKKI